MIEIGKASIHGLEIAIPSMRNPKNSWDKSDSYSYARVVDENHIDSGYIIGNNDLKLASTLANAGTEHGKFLRMINVYADITAPLYWYKEMDTYKVGTVCNSCSTMHKIHAKEFTLDDFSHEHIEDLYIEDGDKACDDYSFMSILQSTINALNIARNMYLKTKDKKYWWQMIQLLPSSYNQKRTYMLNYATLRAIYHQRKYHKLNEWHTFCNWIETLPYAKELIMGAEHD